MYINEVRNGYGLEPVEWGNVPLNYNQYGLAPTPDNLEEMKPLTETTVSEEEIITENKALRKALIMERLNKEY